MKKQSEQLPVDRQGYVLSWGNETPMFGGKPIPHDMVAIIGFTLVPKSRMEELGKFKSVKHAQVEFENGEVPVKVFKAVGTNAWLKKAIADRVSLEVDCVAEDIKADEDENS